MRLFATEVACKPRWTGNVLPVLAPPRCPVDRCGQPLTVLPAVTQPALFFHGGYGAAERTTLQVCCACLWVGTARVESVNPRRICDCPMSAALALQALPRWSDDAACLKADPEQFFPEKGSSARPAKLVCNGDDTRPPCPVRDACLEYALDNDERYGVYGGLSERERRRLKRAAS